MEIKTQAKFYKKKKIDSFYLSIWMFIFILLLTWALYFYNLSLEKNISNLDNQIDLKTSALNNLKQDKNVIISKLYFANKNSIEKLNNYSQITTFIRHLYTLRREYNVDFKWFRYNLGKLSTIVIAESDSLWVNYDKTYNFINKYRKDPNAFFSLNLIKSIKTANQWVLNIFDIEMKLKNNFKEILKKYEESKKIKEEKVKDVFKKIKEKVKEKGDK